MKSAQPVSPTIRQIEFELEKAQHGMSMPYDAEHAAGGAKVEAFRRAPGAAGKT
jgi:hypothetical protein